MRALIWISLSTLLGFNSGALRDPGALLQANAQAMTMADDCGEQVCFYPSDDSKSPSWKADARLSKSARKKDAKKYRKRKSVSLSVEVLEARASVFVDGRYLPPAGLDIKPGKHELEVRDGETVVAVGVVTIPSGLDSLKVAVHGDRG